MSDFQVELKAQAQAKGDRLRRTRGRATGFGPA
jgi:hypothetical protein